MALSAAEPIQTFLKKCKWDIGVIVVQRTVCISILSKSILWAVAKCIFLGGSTFSVLFYVMHFADRAFSHGKQVLLWADSLQAGLKLLSIDRWDLNGIMTWQGQARAHPARIYHVRFIRTNKWRCFKFKIFPLLIPFTYETEKVECTFSQQGFFYLTFLRKKHWHEKF